MSTFPTRYRLPVSYNTEIGRIITRWAFLEWRLRETAYLLVKVNPKIGRVAVREPRVVDYITMIEDLTRLRSVDVAVDWKALKNVLGEIGSFRDKLAHGIWVKHNTTKTPVLQEISGKYPPHPGAKSVKARIEPRAVRVTLKNLKEIVHGIDAATATVNALRTKIAAKLSP